MKPDRNTKFSKQRVNNNTFNRMIYLDNGMIGYDGDNFYRLSLSKKPLGGPIDKRYINQHVMNELEHVLNTIRR